MSTPVAIRHDNRGTAEVPYGFVYFNDGRRVAYTSIHGVTSGTGGWPAITEQHRKAAREHLARHFTTVDWTRLGGESTMGGTP